MKLNSIKYLSMLILWLIPYFTLEGRDKKIVGLMQVRNEENILEQHLRALACYTDALVILDDASIDSTPYLLELLAQEFKIEKLILREISSRDSGNETDNSQILLEEGRKIGGTHFIILDADEMFTANCLENNFLKNKILSLNPGDILELNWIHLWRSTDYYRIDKWFNIYGNFIFCDDRKSSYSKKFLHASRSPNNLLGKKYRLEGTHAILHFQFVNWKSLLIKQAWYRCLEHIRLPQTPIEEINKLYAPSKDESGLILKKVPDYWFKGYEFFNPYIYFNDDLQKWRKDQILSWFKIYGKDYFKAIDIWDIDWKE